MDVLNRHAPYSKGQIQNFSFCCTLLGEKVEWFYKVELVATLIKMCVVLGLWCIREERPKLRKLTEVFKGLHRVVKFQVAYK